MGITKTKIYSKQQNDIAQFFKVLGHPARVAILQHISKQNSCICNDLVDEIGLAQATISQHLKELKDAGLIQGEVNPPKIKYCIHQENWEKAKGLFHNFFSKEHSKKSC